ncbi:hypothetical protein HanXRQr2_Chr04g0167871 [Helianthus annuus]|uniref:Oxidative stress 3 n=2 Tax=Helianthus annuus TaxID=4232 RepID=A0A251UXQ1_HELAN|nr:hypothetical protein HanXRQr2_Chr04g0167871 [Helianthus annuus]KAJ0588997.1 hypothetical protein HanIR_Chr04g0181111 [Helianthus annuus]KAJ0931427.1 hypothetical protein HanPSC8_Chr04g0161541 [Helianthus annuus]
MQKSLYLIYTKHILYNLHAHATFKIILCFILFPTTYPKKYLSFYQDLKMGEIEKGQITIHQEMGVKENDKSHLERLQWGFMEAKDDACSYDLMESDLDDSFDSSSSTEDASSSSSCSPLFELSDLMAQLPIKRGISKFYQGKSESFSSLTSVKSVADLAKKEKYCFKSRSSMKRYGQTQSQRLSPKATIAKNKKGSSSTSTKGSMFSSLGNMSSLIAS